MKGKPHISEEIICLLRRLLAVKGAGPMASITVFPSRHSSGKKYGVVKLALANTTDKTRLT